MSELFIKSAIIFLLFPLTFIVGTFTFDIIRGYTMKNKNIISRSVVVIIGLSVIFFVTLIILQSFFKNPKQDSSKVLASICNHSI